jgi:hypothetical protein
LAITAEQYTTDFPSALGYDDSCFHFFAELEPLLLKTPNLPSLEPAAV